MRALGSIMLLCSMLFAGSWERITLGDHALLVLREPYDLYDSKGISARFYIEDEAQNLHYLHTLVLEDKTGGCSGKSFERGTYEVKDDRLILYHLWDRIRTKKDAPFGAGIEIYKLQNGALKRTSNKIYIESHQRRRHDTSGMAYLFQPPKTDADKAKLQAYKAQIEKRYHGTFVAKEPLLSEVREALQPKKRSVWEMR